MSKGINVREVAETQDNKHLSKGFGLHKCDGCNAVTGNKQNTYGIYLCDSCKESEEGE